MISTPVGMRCRTCANLRRPPMYELSGRYRWQAVAASMVISVVGTLVFNLLLGIVGRSILLAGVLFLATGIGVAELLSLATNRKRGPALQPLAIVVTVIITQSPLITSLILAHRLNFNILSVALTVAASILAWQRLR